ncbi:hypothetical protein JCGZ_16934 [Jatropha curcas]|uniref:Uncharacterized protein n=1 Tax=Jatropha curcas TaxID=180498 RepID=A0A067K6E2_JATCU|nr:hypothetical protein JCGZ_16934 [Jatropha curcas]
MLGRIEKELIEEHNKEIDEAIQQCQTIIEQNQSLIKTLEKMKDVNIRKLATLRVKGTTYIPSSEKPKNVKHTVGKHKTHGRKPPLHPASKKPESSSEIAPVQPLRSSKRLRTELRTVNTQILRLKSLFSSGLRTVRPDRRPFGKFIGNMPIWYLKCPENYEDLGTGLGIFFGGPELPEKPPE